MAQTLNIARLGQGPLVVLLHGWGLNRGIWHPLAKRLAEQYQVITLDLPGFGENNAQFPTPYTLESVAELVVQAIPQEAVYIGWSLGGLVATQIALAWPEQVKALITVTSSPCFVNNSDWPGIKEEVLQGFHRQLARNPQKTIDNFLAIQAMGSPHIRQDVKKIQKLIAEHPPAAATALDAALSLLDQTDMRARLHEIRQPFLRLYGQLDSLVPKAVIEQVASLAPHSEQHVFAKASHAPFISHENEFYLYLSQWLEEKIDSQE
jgi:pimeloyl-[acyl-carrier protein] methyl ester esterase